MNNREILSLIADEERKANISETQAEALRKYLASVYLSQYIQLTVEPLFEEVVEETQQRLENKFNDLLEYIATRSGE